MTPFFIPWKIVTPYHPKQTNLLATSYSIKPPHSIRLYIFMAVKFSKSLNQPLVTNSIRWWPFSKKLPHKHDLCHAPSCWVGLMLVGTIFNFQKLEKLFKAFKVFHWVALLQKMPYHHKLEIFLFLLYLATIHQLSNNCVYWLGCTQLFVLHMWVKMTKVILPNNNVWFCV